MVGASDDRRFEEEAAGWDDGSEHRLETEQLELTSEEERLPWLESPEDDDEAGYEGYDTGRMLVFFVLGLVGLAAVVGGIWWVTNRGTDSALVADGSVIAAPETPYKTPPQNPGGKTFDGTGDSSFAVSEGQNRPPQLAGAVTQIKPAASPAPTASAAAPAASAATAPATSGGVGVQVGAFSTQASAQAAWQKLTDKAGDVLSGVPHRIVQGSADIGTVYRLQAVAPDAAAANALCSKLKSAGISCAVK